MMEYVELIIKFGVFVSVFLIMREVFVKLVRLGKLFIYVFCNIFF